MRRSDHPSRPSAITCCRFSALKTLPIPAAGVQPTAQVNVSAPGAALAGFQVSINGRFWVSTEDDRSETAHGACTPPGLRRYAPARPAVKRKQRSSARPRRPRLLAVPLPSLATSGPPFRKLTGPEPRPRSPHVQDRPAFPARFFWAIFFPYCRVSEV